MALFDRMRPSTMRAAASARGRRRAESADARAHLEDFVRSRPGVEAFVEPATAVLPPTVLLVASTGEWTRRRASAEGVRALTEGLGVPVYDARLVGYPRRMREWNARADRERGPSPH